MQPGVYCGWHNFNNSSADVEFSPGLYVIRNGGWNVNGGNWSGDGVTFYMYDSSIVNFNSNVRADLTAPTTGDYKDIILTERPGISYRNFNLNSVLGFLRLWVFKFMKKIKFRQPLGRAEVGEHVGVLGVHALGGGEPPAAVAHELLAEVANGPLLIVLPVRLEPGPLEHPGSVEGLGL